MTVPTCDRFIEPILRFLAERPDGAPAREVLDLLHRMGYGTRRTDLRQVGGAGDGGIDGVISLDRLGLEKAYVQAKRWQGTVGRPEIQGFYGALAGQRANKGVFITTSDYTAQARDFARSVERIVLVGRRQPVELMTEHEVDLPRALASSCGARDRQGTAPLHPGDRPAAAAPLTRSQRPA